MKLPIITAFLTVFLVSAWQNNAIAQSNADSTISLSLKQAQDYALQNNLLSKNTILDLEIAKKRVWETTAIGLPQVNGNVNYTHLFTVPELSLGGTTFLTTDLPPGTPLTSTDILNENVYMGFTPAAPIQLGVPNNITYDITVSQLVFSGEYLVGLQGVKVYYQMADLKKKKADLDVKETVSNSYILALVLEQTRDVLIKSLDNTNKTLFEMQQMYKQGLVENTDVDQIELISLNLTNGLSSTNRQINATYDLIKYQLGMPFTNILVLTDGLENLSGTINLESIVATQFNLNNNIDYNLVTTAETISKIQLKLAKTAYLPSISAIYMHSGKVNQPAFDFNPTDIFQVGMSVPIFSSGIRNSRVQQRTMDLQKSTNAKNDIANGLNLQYINTRNELTTAYEKYLNDQKNIELTKRIYDKTIIKFQEGIATSRQITDDLNQYLTAQGNYFNSIFSIISAKNKLDKLNNNL
jgi:outer membrane protein TolC